MGIVVTLEDFRPPDRFDTVPWSEALIYESDTATGSFTLIDTLTISPVDSDPEHPALRSFTTTEGTDEDLWYRIVFRDASANLSIPTIAIQNSTDAVTPYATVDELARILKIRTPSAEQTVAMERVLAAAAGEIDSEVGRDSDDPLAGWELALATEVNVERAVEHWQQQEVPWGIVMGAAETTAYVAKDTWERHANKLAPLKASWGLA